MILGGLLSYIAFFAASFALFLPLRLVLCGTLMLALHLSARASLSVLMKAIGDV